MSTACRCAEDLLETGAPPSLVSRLDPRVRVLGAVLFAFAVVALNHLAVLAGAVALAVIAALLAQLPLRQTLRRMLALEGFMLVVLALLPFTVPGDAVGHVLGFAVSYQGLAQAAAIILKANAVTLAVLALLGSMEAATLGRALARLGLPERLAVLFLFTIRYVEVLDHELARLRLAMRARGFRPTTSIHTWRSMGWLVGMLLVMSTERAERIHAAMRCRGFTGRFHLVDDTRAGALDLGFATAHLGTLALMLALDLL